MPFGKFRKATEQIAQSDKERIGSGQNILGQVVYWFPPSSPKPEISPLVSFCFAASADSSHLLL